MKISDEVLEEMLAVIDDEWLVRFQVRLKKRDGIAMRKDARKHLRELLAAELTRREHNDKAEANKLAEVQASKTKRNKETT